MPKIDINAAPNVSSLVSTQRADGAYFGPGAGLQQPGAAMVDVGKTLKAHSDRATAVEIEKGLIDGGIEMSKKAMQLEEQAAAGGFGHTEAVVGLTNEYGDKFKENFSTASPENKQRMELGLARLKSSTVSGAMRFQAKKRGEKIRSDVDTGLNSLMASVNDGTMALNDAMQKGNNLIGATGLDANYVSAATVKFRSDLAVKEADRMLRNADQPEEIVGIKGYAEKELKQHLDADQYSILLNKIDKADEQVQAKAEITFKSELGEQIDANNNGAAGSGITRADIVASIKDKKEAALLVKKADKAASVYKYSQRIAGMSKADLNSEEDAVRAQMKIEGNYDVEAGQMAAIGRERVMQNKEERKDLEAFDMSIAKSTPEELDVIYNDLEKQRETSGRTDLIDAKMGEIDRRRGIISRKEDVLTTELTDQLADIADGKSSLKPNDLKEKIINGVTSEDRRNKWLRAVDVAIAQGEQAKSVPTMSTSEIAQRNIDFDEAIKGLEGSERFKAQKEYEAFQAAVKKREAEIKRDPVEFARKNNPTVQSAKDNFDAIKGSNWSASQESSQAYYVAQNKYVAAQQAAQIRLGIHPNNVKLLSASEVIAMDNMMHEIDPNSASPSGAQVAEKLQKLQVDWGANFRYINKQLQKDKVFTGIESVAASMANTEAAKKLLELSRADNKAFDTLKDQAKSSEINAAVLSQGNKFFVTLAPQPGGVDKIADYSNSMTILTKGHMLNGDTAEGAAQKAYNEIIGKEYVFSGKIRIPVSPNIDTDNVISGSGYALQFMKFDDVVPTRSRDESLTLDEVKAQNISTLRDSGQWITAPDEDGLILLNQQGVPQFRIGQDGLPEPYKVTWEQLENMRPPEGPSGP